jgi:anti-anti-sigma regulatory factor
MVMIKMNERPMGDVMVLEVSGRIAAGAPEVEFGNAVRGILLRGYRKVLLNLARATSSDASGVSALVGALLDAREAAAELRLVGMARQTDLRILVALHRYFDVCASESEGLASFNGTPAAAGRAAETWLEPAAAA